MELSVLVEQTPDRRFRASSGEPLSASAQAPTREEALEQLRQQIQTRLQGGAELVRLRIDVPTPPTWPQDELTTAWLEGIAAARAADARPEPWALPDGATNP